MEIMAPAGSWEMLRAVVAAGADAIYFGSDQFNLRANHAANFPRDEITRVIEYAHQHGVRAYFCANTLPTTPQIEAYFGLLDHVVRCSPDGLILSSLGVISAVSRKYDVMIIASVWAGASNARGARLLGEIGAREVTAARQMTLDEIRRLVSSSGSQVRIRTFVAGNWCANLDGRCYMNSFLSTQRIHADGCCGPATRDRAHCVERRQSFFPTLTGAVGTLSVATLHNPCRVRWSRSGDRSPFLLQVPGEQIRVNLSEIMRTGVEGLKVNGRAGFILPLCDSIVAIRACLAGAVPRED